MNNHRKMQTDDTILQVVQDILESEGYDAVRIRTVAKRARVSMATIYGFFPTRDELIVAALERWMDSNCYSAMADPPPDSSLEETLNWVHRQFFEPWERHPRMLQAYHRARTVPGGDRLDMQGISAVTPVAQAALKSCDAAYAEDVVLILVNMVCGVIERFAVGDLPIDQILPVLERTVSRLTADNAALASPGPDRGPRRMESAS